MERCSCMSRYRALPLCLQKVNSGELLAQKWNLCALDRDGVQQVQGGMIRCRTLLLPEGTTIAQQAQQVVSYGLSEKNSLTLSGMGQRPILCVQRQLQTVDGGIVEIQEMPIPTAWQEYSSERQLFTAGVWLLLYGRLNET